MLAGQIDDKMRGANINVRPTPKYTEDFQIDEAAFEHTLDDEISYYNPRAKEFDINSVRSIYVLRGNISPNTLEKSRAVFVTSNVGFARAAFLYGQQFKQTSEVSSVITDFSLANMAWLKAPMGAPALPKTEILAFSYAALQPTQSMLNKYLKEIEKLQNRGEISARDHQLLRSHPLALEELMHFTLGDEEALSEDKIIDTLEKITQDIKKEESEKLRIEKSEHEKTQRQLSEELTRKGKISQMLYWRCKRRASVLSWIHGCLIIS